jgi:hypothetical protein
LLPAGFKSSSRRSGPYTPVANRSSLATALTGSIGRDFSWFTSRRRATSSIALSPDTSVNCAAGGRWRNAVFISLIKPLGKWLSKLPIFARIDDLIRSLGPYPTFALFAVPVIVLEPIKPVGLYLIAEGKVVDGAVLIAIGEIAKITIIERIFHAGRDKLMTIPAFAWCYERVMAFRAYLETLAVWQAMLKALRAIKERGKTNIRILQGLSQVVAASSRLARRWRGR